MTTVEHATAIISVHRLRTGECGYRAVCSCNWRGRRYPSDKRHLAEDDERRHHEHLATVGRLIGRGRG